MNADSATTVRFLLASRQCELNSLRYLLQTGELVGKISQMVHMLQRERGTSNLYLCTQGRLCGEQLAQRAQDAHAAQVALLHHLDQLETLTAALPQASRLLSRVASVVYALSLLPALRQQVHQLTAQDAIAFFNDTIRHLLALVFELSDAAAEPAISRALIAQFSFMQGKELAGQERAAGVAALAAGQLDEHSQHTLLDLIERQDRCFATFAEFCDAAHRQRWLDLTPDSEFERLRRIACTRRTRQGADEAESLRWFSVATQRIDGMKQLEDGLQASLMDLCRARIAVQEQANNEQRADITSLMEQHTQDRGGYAVFVPDAGHEQGEWLANDEGVTPQLSRSLLSLVQQQARRLQALDHELTTLRATLNERKAIDRAKSLLMQHRALSEEEAYKTLRRMAMNQNKKLVEIATAMLAVADILQESP